MGRIHLFEIEDQTWFPTFLRNYLTDFLQFLSNTAKIYKPIVPLLTEKIKSTGGHQIIDLASGGGGGLLWLNSQLKENIPNLKITLTDYYPNFAAFKRTQAQSDNFSYEIQSVDARNVPEHLKDSAHNSFRSIILNRRMHKRYCKMPSIPIAPLRYLRHRKEASRVYWLWYYPLSVCC